MGQPNTSLNAPQAFKIPGHPGPFKTLPDSYLQFKARAITRELKRKCPIRTINPIWEELAQRPGPRGRMWTPRQTNNTNRASERSRSNQRQALKNQNGLRRSLPRTQGRAYSAQRPHKQSTLGQGAPRRARSLSFGPRTLPPCKKCGSRQHGWLVCPNVICPNCNEKGHPFQDCPKPSSIPRTQVRPNIRTNPRHGARIPIVLDRSTLKQHDPRLRDLSDRLRDCSICLTSFTRSMQGDNNNAYCLHCKRTTHKAHECPHAHRDIECYSCKTTDHDQKDCPDKYCYRCRTVTHHLHECTYTLMAIRCNVCKNTGHRNHDCPTIFFCEHCQRPGHKTIYCPTQITGGCYVCKQMTHKGNTCPSRYCPACKTGDHHYTECPANNRAPFCTMCVEYGHFMFNCPIDNNPRTPGSVPNGVNEGVELTAEKEDEGYDTTDQGKQAKRVQCWICKKKGHRKGECQIGKTNSWFNGRCFHCKKAGHKEKTCPELTKQRTTEQKQDPRENQGNGDRQNASRRTNLHLELSTGYTNQKAETENSPKEQTFLKNWHENEGKKKNKCLFCGETDHGTNICHTKTPMGKFRCFKCRELGHWTKDCPDAMLYDSQEFQNDILFERDPLGGQAEICIGCLEEYHTEDQHAKNASANPWYNYCEKCFNGTHGKEFHLAQLIREIETKPDEKPGWKANCMSCRQELYDCDHVKPIIPRFRREVLDKMLIQAWRLDLHHQPRPTNTPGGNLAERENPKHYYAAWYEDCEKCTNNTHHRGHDEDRDIHLRERAAETGHPFPYLTSLRSPSQNA